MTKRTFKLWWKMLSPPVMASGDGIREFLVTQVTVVGFRSSVNVHVLVSAVFVGKHFGTEIAFEFGRQMAFAVRFKIL